ncbi:MAG: hypothetical protein JXA71_08345, partial [Chitinispirillaceae bacterium]|nr:hypothetical protein [Chitinispirillaceae bacterium]
SRGNEQTGENQRHSAAPLGAKNFHSAALLIKTFYCKVVITSSCYHFIIPAAAFNSLAQIY